VTWQFALTGLLVGLIVGATGMGGGSLMTPILVLVLGFQPVIAVGTDILHGAIFKTAGAFRHRRLGTVQGRLSSWLLGPAVQRSDTRHSRRSLWTFGGAVVAAGLCASLASIAGRVRARDPGRAAQVSIGSLSNLG
jgi:uncharacterized membrane protein YfcA